MKLPRVRLTVRRLMVAVAVVAVLTYKAIEYWRWSADCAVNARDYRMCENQAKAVRRWAAKLIPGKPLESITYAEFQAAGIPAAGDGASEIAMEAWYGRMAAKFERCARYPWLPFPHGPPMPEPWLRFRYGHDLR